MPEHGQEHGHTDRHGQTQTGTDSTDGNPVAIRPSDQNLQPDDAGASTNGRWQTGRHTGTTGTKGTKGTPTRRPADP